MEEGLSSDKYNLTVDIPLATAVELFVVTPMFLQALLRDTFVGYLRRGGLGCPFALYFLHTVHGYNAFAFVFCVTTVFPLFRGMNEPSHGRIILVHQEILSNLLVPGGS